MLKENERILTAKALSMALEAGAAKARITLSKSKMDLVATLDGEVDKVTSCLDSSLEICLFADGRFGSFSTNRLEEQALQSFIRGAVQTVKMLAPDAARDLPRPERQVKNAVSGNELGLYDPEIEQSDAPQRLQAALSAAAWPAEGDGWKLISEEGEYSESDELSYVLDSQGLEALHCETCFSYGVESTIKDSRGRKYSGYWWDSSARKSGLDISTIGSRAIAQALAQKGSRRIRSGKYTMVVDSEAASRMVSPVLRALGGYSIQQGNSFLTGSIGRQMFPKGLTLMDSPHRKGENGSRLFDSEGVASCEHSVIEDGVVKEYFLNTYIAAKLGMAPTHEEALRPLLLPFGPKECTDRDSIMRFCGKGILVTDFNGGNSNPATGDFSYGVEGIYFEDGKPVRPVSGMVVTGNFLSLWAGLLAAGSDARACKDKLIPTLAFEGVDFSGE